MANVVAGGFAQHWMEGLCQNYPLSLWKTLVTVPALATTVSIEPDNDVAGTVVAVWIDPGTLTAAATIKGYMQDDALATLGPDCFLNYTVPNPAVETRAALYARTRVSGKLQIDVASATAADTFTVYVWVDPSADSSVGVGVGSAASGSAYGSRQSKARPTGTTAYEAGDCIGTATDATAAYTFPVGPAAGGEVMITSVSLEVDVNAVPSGMTTFKLHLYNVTPPSALGDGVAWDLPAGDRTAYLGFVDIDAPVDVGSTLYIQMLGVNKQVTLASANLFAYLVSVGGYTPAASTVKAVDLHTIRL